MANKIAYMSYANTLEGTNYCSGVETLAENIIEDNEEDAVLSFPSKDGWASLRSTAYRMTTENTEAVLPLPIYKIKKVEIRLPDCFLYFSDAQVSPSPFDLFTVKNESGSPVFQELDITKYVKSAIEREALAISVGALLPIPYIGGVSKDNTFYWELGSNKILFLPTIYPRGVALVDEDPVYERLIKSAIADKGKNYNVSLGVSEGVLTYSVYNMLRLHKTYFAADSKSADVRNWQFRIEYVPISTKTKIRARKAAKTREEFIQPFNQRAEINAASAFGKNMYLTAQKTGVKELVLVKRYTRLADIPPISTMIYQNGKTYRLVANNYKITNTIYVEVTHVYSENWSRKSQHVSVDQKYRNWKIPQDILWRNLYREDYLICSTHHITPLVPSKLSVDLATQLFHCGYDPEDDTSEDKTINTLCWLFTPKGKTAVKGVTVPCSTYGTANSMIFSATFKDNLSAGLTMSQKATDTQDALCEEAFYCNEDGTLDEATVVLSSGLNSRRYDAENDSFGSDEFNIAVGLANMAALSKYPKISFYSDPLGNKAAANAPKDELYRDTYKILKDPGEALKYTYQVHIVPDQEDLGMIVIGDKFAELSPLVKGWDGKRKLRLVFSEKPIREGEQIVSGDYVTQTYDGEFFSYNPGSVDLNAYISITNKTWSSFTNKSKYVAWAICDEKNRLLIGCNNVTIYKKIFFSMAHKR